MEKSALPYPTVSFQPKAAHSRKEICYYYMSFGVSIDNIKQTILISELNLQET